MDKNTFNLLVAFCFEELGEDEMDEVETQICNNRFLHDVVIGMLQLKKELKTKKAFLYYFRNSNDRGKRRLTALFKEGDFIVESCEEERMMKELLS